MILASCIADRRDPSRVENAVSWRMLARMGLGMIDAFCDSYARVPGQIVLDIDDTVDLVHGGQQLSLFSTHAGDTCFQPILIFEAGAGKPVAAILRPGKRPSGKEAARVIGHVIRRIRANWPRVGIMLRGDGHYGAPEVRDTLEVMDTLEDADCTCIFGLPGNARLKSVAAPWNEDAATRHAQHAGHRAHALHHRRPRPVTAAATVPQSAPGRTRDQQPVNALKPEPR